MNNNFLGKMEYSVFHECGTKSESLTGIEPMTSYTLVSCSNNGATGRLVASKVTFTGFIVTRILHTAKITNVEQFFCSESLLFVL